MQNGVVINKGAIGPAVNGDPFKVSALVTTGVAVTDGLDLGKPYRIFQLSEAEALGLNPDYDATHNVALYEHIREYFRMATPGVPLWLLVLAQTATFADVIGTAPAPGTPATGGYQLLTEAGGEIFNIALGFNPESTFVETAVDGISANVRNGLPAAQALANWAYQTHKPVQILIEGRAYAGNPTSALDLSAIPDGTGGTLEFPKLSVVIGQDWDFAENLTGLARKHAAIGTALGTLAACEVNQSIGEVASFNLTDVLKGKWITGGLSSHQKCTDVDADLGTLNAKKFIFGDRYVGISGYRWNNEYTCAPPVIDTDGKINEHTIAFSRALDYAVRELRKALLPQVQTVKPVNPATGKMPPGIIKELEGIGNNVFDNLAAKGRISGGKTWVDPDSDILIEKTVKVKFQVAPYGNINAITGTVNLQIS